jgi:hypothetical protein
MGPKAIRKVPRFDIFSGIKVRGRAVGAVGGTLGPFPTS